MLKSALDFIICRYMWTGLSAQPSARAATQLATLYLYYLYIYSVQTPSQYKHVPQTYEAPKRKPKISPRKTTSPLLRKMA